ncbi:GDNF-inducible zinc finger protein 1-like [Hetaerina americana]|uniref:GDNF-inducible zinc finger protein 1-like n=1 Tax=Hetaerina americana TaxID=62018 RepID=UPI003A7F22CD
MVRHHYHVDPSCQPILHFKVERVVLSNDNEASESPGVDVVTGTSDNVIALSSPMIAAGQSVEGQSFEEEDRYSANRKLSLMADNYCKEDEIQDDSEDIELHLSSDEKVNRKEEFDADKLHEERHLREKELLSQDGGQKLGGPVEDTAGTVLHVCQICNKVFAQRDLLKAHVMHVHLNKVMQFTCEFCSELFERKHDLGRHIKLVHAVKKKPQYSQPEVDKVLLSSLSVGQIWYTERK